MAGRPESTSGELLAEAVTRTRAAAAGERKPPLEAELRDGTRVQLRPIRPDDKESLRRALAWLSPRSKQLGFHHPLDHLTDAQLRYVTEIDHRDHVAWVGLDPAAVPAPPAAPGPPGVAIARYVRTRHTPAVAEAAITVVDDYQGRGLGTLLLGLLAAVAVDNDVEVFRNYVLSDNEAVLDLFDQLGATRQPLTRDVFEVDLPLPSDVEELAQTPMGRMLRTFATSQIEDSHLALTVPPLWVRRRRAKRKPSDHEPAWQNLRERGPFADWLDAVMEGDDPSETHDPSEDGADETP